MGCFTVLKNKKKKSMQTTYVRHVNPLGYSPTTLPEPHIQTHALRSAPPSFRTRVKSVQPIGRVSIGTTRALSAPSSLNAEEQEAVSSIECEEHEESKNRNRSMECRSPNPQPLPLPSPQIQTTTVLKTMDSFKAGAFSGPLNASGPLPLPPLGTLRNFSHEEIAVACNNFSPERCMTENFSSMMYRASFGEDTSGLKKLDATVIRLHPSTQGLKEFVNEVNTLASLQHPNLCKLIGFHAREGSEQRILKVALCAAQGLTFLHEEGLFQAMFNEFSTANIQIDKNFSAKLSGYGCINRIPKAEICNSYFALANLSVETLERGMLTPKSNVWTFGIVLLELLTGRKNLDSHHSKEERNLVKWSWPFLADEYRLSLIMDPQLKGRFPAKAARTVADIAQSCLHKDPS
ncbi:hypothetical protein U1Q18_010272 [Sarracenia purpurea var. burkii]